jgi:hypothetical protein
LFVSITSYLNQPFNPLIRKDKAALETHSLFLPKAYFNTGVDSALDQTISTQLGGISLVDSTATEGTPSLEKDVCDQNCDQKVTFNSSIVLKILSEEGKKWERWVNLHLSCP